MQINTKFNVGDTVFVIRQQSKTTPCPYCLGDGSIITHDDRVLECQRCEGKKYAHCESVFSVQETRIGKIAIDVSTRKTPRIAYEMGHHHDGGFYQRSYENAIYATAEECQRALDDLLEDMAPSDEDEDHA